jgi:hypothetical protein
MGNRHHSLDRRDIQASSLSMLSYLHIPESSFSSPLTANIYFPAIPAMAVAFHKSTELINVTVTVYMVFQGICQFSIIYPKSWNSPLT